MDTEEDAGDIINYESYQKVKWQRKLLVFATFLTIVGLEPFSHLLGNF